VLESKGTGLVASLAPAGPLFERSARFALVLPSPPFRGSQE
jgi:hypothetical protein